VETFTFHGYWGAQSKCGLDILRRPDGTAWVMLTEVPDNKGTSITNAFEYLATLIKRTWLGELPPEAITWVEHYPERSEETNRIPETWDLVTVDWDEARGKYGQPHWKHLRQPPKELQEIQSQQERRRVNHRQLKQAACPCHSPTRIRARDVRHVD